MTREQRLTMADIATTRAAGLAREAEDAARSLNSRHHAAPLAAAGALWADLARAHAAIAAVLPETEPTDG
ncbi:hypothetical protein [Streptomyces caeruleatus]|uniref:Uncharacterized protein n=1 Tax=Streptomyces caeruleatus TaxID=661399 RepID=A0A101TGG7_9ACTN|nr:hypothetical protein [Streptomyces caeruleatus]KUN91887.1 hypothetical protein AQJ67_41385 [Streptomyces caeruleatus]